MVLSITEYSISIKKQIVEETRQHTQNTYWYHLLVNKWFSTFSLICPNCKCSNHECISLKDNNGLDDMLGEKDSFLYHIYFYNKCIFVVLLFNALCVTWNGDDNFFIMLMSTSETYGTIVSMKINTCNGTAILDRFIRDER